MEIKLKWFLVGNCSYNDASIDDVPSIKESVGMLETAIRNVYGNSADIVYKENLLNQDFLVSIGKFFSDIEDGIVPIFYFCGHGYRRDKHLYLAAKDSVSNGIENSSVGYDYILRCIKDNHVKQAVIILDCCYSGIANGLEVANDFVPSLPEEDYPNIICLTSCKSVEKAYFKETINHQFLAAFTYYFASTINEGIENRNHWMSFKEIYKNIKNKLVNQSPTISATGSFDSNKFISNNRYSNPIRLNFAVEQETNKLKVLLVKSSIKYPIKDDGDFGIPLGLWLLKSYIQRTTTNIVVDIFDERLRALKGDNESFEDCAKKYDVIGTSMCSCEVPPSLEKMRIAKNLGKITIAGGIFTYSNESYLLEYPFVDFVIPGAGTLPTAKLLNELRKRKERSRLDTIVRHINEESFDCFGLQNVFSRCNQNDAVMWETASMPHIELDVWDEIIRQYGPYINGKIDMYTSRGCNKTCSFCSVQRETKRNVISCDNEHIIRSIRYLYNKGIRKFSIKDEDFFLHGESRVREILEQFKNYEDISFKIRARIDTILASNVSIEDLAEYHICEIQYGVESPDNELRKQIQKNIGRTNEDVIKLFNSHYKCGIVVNASFILGLPGENTTYYSTLVSFIRSIYSPGMTRVYLNFYTPHPAKCRIPEDAILITNDLNYYTHKIPVCYSRAQPPRIYVRKRMIAAYDEIVKLTNSQNFNPTIPDWIKRRYESDFRMGNNEIMEYGVDN